MNSPSRNAPCPCGSGKKYKRCCAGKKRPQSDVPYAQTGLTREVLSEAYQLEAQNEFGKAVPLYRRLLEQHSQHPALLWGLGRSLMELRRRHEAADILVQAVTVYPQHEKMVEDAVTRLNILGKPDRALGIAAAAGSNFPGNINILLYKSDALRSLRRDEEAVEVLREIIAREPGHPRATVELVKSLRSLGELDKAVELISTRLAESGRADLERGMLLNELAHIKDQAGDYPAAFAALDESGRLLAVSPEASRHSTERFMQNLTLFKTWVSKNGLPQVEPDPEQRDTRLAFMLGFPRSGTTLLESMLASVEGVVTSDESALIEIPVSYALAQGLADDQVLDALASDKQLLARARQKFWDNMDREYGRDYKLFIDKQPMNTFNLAHIRLLFPGAKIIFSIRDPRDVCLSCFFQWLGFAQISTLFLDWQTTADTYARMMSYWIEIEPHLNDAVCKVRYEDLVSTLPVELRRVVEYLGLPWDDELLSFTARSQDKHYTTPSNRAVKEQVTRAAVQRWKNYPEAVAQIQPVLAPMIEHFGYEP
jgi:tetratricopeptide (TPR) repeat protein